MTLGQLALGCALLAALVLASPQPRNVAAKFVIDEPCRADAYPPPEDSRIPNVTLNLDLPPEQRWTEIARAKKHEMIELLSVIKELLPEKIMTLVDIGMDKIEKWLPAEYRLEIEGIAAGSGLPLSEAVLFNIFYEIFTMCTSIVGHDHAGKMYHARNMDFGLLMGWDNQNNTWAVTERLRRLMVVVDYQRGGVTVFKSLHFVGYVGVLTAVKKGAFTLTVNERFALDGGYMGIIEWLLGVSKGHWMGFHTRDVMGNATNFLQAQQMLSETELLAPVYFILAGLEPGQEAVITRARKKVDDLWTTNLAKNEWYLLETNYDHWEPPMVIDDRRTPGLKCMNNMTQEAMGFRGLFNVLSTRSTLNKLTTYSALMQVDDGVLDAYVQDCKDPCWPW